MKYVQRSSLMSFQDNGDAENQPSGSGSAPEYGALELQRALRLPEVLHLTGMSRSSWYALLNSSSSSYDPAAPKPFKLGASQRSISVWWAWEVLGYLREKSSKRHADAGVH
jgi:predicted DNA-binding transcriptional regulator AlpA